ncbi:Cupredoxin [Hyaloscypha variabilis]
MQFTTFALSALSIGSALAATTTSSAASTVGTSTSSSGQVVVHVVKVGNANGTLEYSPNNIKANVGDLVQFQFAPNNHTVTQSTFAQPCQPIALNSPGTVGFFSGFMPVALTATTTPTYTIPINNTTPIWIYCSQASHCQKGMVMVINENAATNKTLAAFQALAAQATVNLPGTATSVSSGTSGTSGTSSGSTGSGSGSGSTTTSAGSAKSTTSSSSIITVQASFVGAFVALVAVVLL